MFHFATYFDKNYLGRGITLYDSLRTTCKQFNLYVLCLDTYTFDYFTKNKTNFPCLTLLTLQEIEESDKQLMNCKSNRSKIEYYFSLSPCLPLHILKKYNLSHICTLDADILFLEDPATLFHHLNNYSIIITPHKFSKELEANKKFGTYNVSFQIFKNDVTGLNCLKLWREQCIDWCGDSFDDVNQRFADQKYLDNWHSLYPGKIKDLDDEISGLAPWNLNNFMITKQKEFYFSNGKRIIFFHFHHYKFFNSFTAFNGFHAYKVKANAAIKSLYLFYWDKISEKTKFLNSSGESSARYYSSNNLLSNIYYEKTFFIKLFGKKLLLFNFNWLSSILNKILRKNA
ncbi:MAG: hypothetical protein ABIP51_16945 [Bacteroidia bacterium]